MFSILVRQHLGSNMVSSLFDTGELFVGRSSDAGYLDTEPSVSRMHLKLNLFNDKMTIEDLGSANGTFVNGKIIPPKTPTVVKPGDQIVLGKSRHYYVFEAIAKRMQKVGEIGPDDLLAQAKKQAESLHAEAKAKIDQELSRATDQAQKIISDAEIRAKQILTEADRNSVEALNSQEMSEDTAIRFNPVSGSTENDEKALKILEDARQDAARIVAEALAQSEREAEHRKSLAKTFEDRTLREVKEKEKAILLEIESRNNQAKADLESEISRERQKFELEKKMALETLEFDKSTSARMLQEARQNAEEVIRLAKLQRDKMISEAQQETARVIKEGQAHVADIQKMAKESALQVAAAEAEELRRRAAADEALSRDRKLAHEREIQILQAQIKDSTNVFNETRQSITESRKEMDVLNQKMTALVSEVEAYEPKAQKLREDLKNLEMQKTVAQGQTAEYEKICKSASDQLTLLRAAREKEEDALQVLREKALRSTMSLEAQLELLRKQKLEMEKEISEAKGRMDSWQNKLEQDKAEHVEIQKKLELANQKLEQLTRDEIQVHSRVDGLKSHFADLEGKFKERHERLSQEFHAAKTRAQNELAELESRSKFAEDKVEESRNLAKKLVEDAKEQAAAAMAQILDRVNQNKEKAQILEEKVNLARKEVAELHAKKQENEAEFRRYEIQKMDLQTQITELESAQQKMIQEVYRLKENKVFEESELHKLRELALRETKDLEKSSDELRHSLLIMEKEFASKQNEVEGWQKQIKAFQSEKEEILRVVSEAKSRIHDLSTEEFHLKRSVEATKSNLEKLEFTFRENEAKLKKETDESLRRAQESIDSMQAKELQSFEEMRQNEGRKLEEFKKQIALDIESIKQSHIGGIVARVADLLISPSTKLLQNTPAFSKYLSENIRLILEKEIFERRDVEVEAQHLQKLRAKKLAIGVAAVASAALLFYASQFWLSEGANNHIERKIMSTNSNGRTSNLEGGAESTLENTTENTPENKVKIFSPSQTDQVGGTYTDRVLYTRFYLEIKSDPKYQDLWNRALVDWGTNKAKLTPEAIKKIGNLEANLLMQLKEKRGQIDPDAEAEGVLRLRRTEAEFEAKLKVELGLAFAEFVQFSNQHFLNYRN